MGEEEKKSKITAESGIETNPGASGPNKPNKDGELNDSAKEEWHDKIYISLCIVILLVLLISSCFIFGKCIIENPLLLPGVLLIFVLFDFSIFLLNSHINHKEKQKKIAPQNSESIKYHPNLKIWGMGFILGLTIFIFDYFKPFIDALFGKEHNLLNKSTIVIGENIFLIKCPTTSIELIQQITVILFFLTLVSIILVAIVKIVKDE